MSIESVMPSKHLIFCCPFSSCPQSFSTSGSFPVSRLFTSVVQSIDASASVLPMNIQRWFPLGLTGLISLLSKGLSRVFSSTPVWKPLNDSAADASFENQWVGPWPFAGILQSQNPHLQEAIPSLVLGPLQHRLDTSPLLVLVYSSAHKGILLKACRILFHL